MGEEREGEKGRQYQGNGIRRGGGRLADKGGTKMVRSIEYIGAPVAGWIGFFVSSANSFSSRLTVAYGFNSPFTGPGMTTWVRARYRNVNHRQKETKEEERKGEGAVGQVNQPPQVIIATYGRRGAGRCRSGQR